jgi:hypothetical protein
VSATHFQKGVRLCDRLISMADLLNLQGTLRRFHRLSIAFYFDRFADCAYEPLRLPPR